MQLLFSASHIQGEHSTRELKWKVINLFVKSTSTVVLFACSYIILFLRETDLFYFVWENISLNDSDWNISGVLTSPLCHCYWFINVQLFCFSLFVSVFPKNLQSTMKNRFVFTTENSKYVEYKFWSVDKVFDYQ